MSGGRAWSAALLVALLAAAGGESVAAAPPNNDQFASAQVIAGAGGTLNTVNVESTKEPGEPAHAGDAGGASVWFTWTPTFSGMASVHTSGSDFDTLLAAYSGSSVSALTALAGNDDVAANAATSRICFPVVAGTAVAIAVDGFAARLYLGGYHGDTGHIALNWGQKTDTAPCPTQLPRIDGPAAAPKVGDTLQLDPAAAFTDAVQPARLRWLRCIINCRTIAGASGTSYTVAANDVGTTLAVE